MGFDFGAVYARYPRKEGKKRGMERLERTVKTEADYSAFVLAVDAYINLCKVEGREARFIKHWITFVNNWTDYLEKGIAAPRESVKAQIKDQMQRILRGEL